MKLYVGIDLHSNNITLVILDEESTVRYKRKLLTDLEMILGELSDYREEIAGIVVESTYNWYWLVDGLEEAGYRVHLANTNAATQYNGLKHANDETDARWLAEQLRLGVLKEGYIYPKEQRSLRELVRRRMRFVQQRTMVLVSLQAMILRYHNIRLKADTLKKLPEETVEEYIQDHNLRLIAKQQLQLIHHLTSSIDELETAVINQIKPDKRFKLLQTVPGIGKILGMLILLESGDYQRFQGPGNYASYCRCVKSERVSNGKKKGENNRKNGNVYLSWAFIEVANRAKTMNKEIGRYFQRKSQRTNSIVATKSVAAKLAKSCYFVLRDEVSFDLKKFSG